MSEYTVTGPAHWGTHLPGGADEVIPDGGTPGQVLTLGADGVLTWTTLPPSLVGGLLAESYVRQTADVTRTDDTLSATGITLSVPVTVSGLYAMEWWLFLDSGDSSTPDAKFDFNESFPSGGSLEGEAWVRQASDSVATSQLITSSTSVIDSALQASADHFPVIIRTTYLAGGTAGAVTLRFAQNTTSGSTRLVAGSFVHVLKVAA